MWYIYHIVDISIYCIYIYCIARYTVCAVYLSYIVNPRYTEYQVHIWSTCTYSEVFVYIYIYIYVCIYMYMYIYIYIYIIIIYCTHMMYTL